MLLVRVLLGVACLVFGWHWLQPGMAIRAQAAASETWPAVDGRIVQSQRRFVFNDGAAAIDADIRYDFSIDGRTYVGHRVWIGDDQTYPCGDEFVAALDRYPEGRQVRVHYDPSRPAESVLEPGITWSGSMKYIVGLMMVGLGTLLVIPPVAKFLLAAFITGTASRGGRDDQPSPR